MMSTIKDDIYKIAKRIEKNQDIDITAEELAALALYKIYNLPYFEQTNQFLSLRYNVFDEIAIGHDDLDNVRGYSNDSIRNFTVKMNLKEKTENEFNIEHQILKQADKDNLLNFIDLLQTSNTTKEVIQKIQEIEKIDNFYFTNLLVRFNDHRHYNKSTLLAIINNFLPYTQKGSDEEYNLDLKNKKNFYRHSKIDTSLSDALFDSYLLKNIIREPIESIITKITPLDLKTITGVEGYDATTIHNFKTDNINMYEKSMFKILVENESYDIRMQKLIDMSLLSEKMNEFCSSMEQNIKNPTAEELLITYSKHLDIIEKNIIKKYPQLSSTIEEFPYETKTIEIKDESEYFRFADKYLENDPLEIYQTDDFQNINYSVVKGLIFYREQYQYNNIIYSSFNNGLEDIIGAFGYRRESVRSSFIEIKLDNIRVSNLYDGAREISLEMKQSIIEEFAKSAQNTTNVLVMDLFERRAGINTVRNIDFKIIIDNLKEKYTDVIFINDGYKQNKIEELANDMQMLLLLTCTQQNISKEKMIEFNKKLEGFLKTPQFKEIAEEEFSEKEKSMNKMIENIIKPSIKKTIKAKV